jgi:hypothetical protein
MSLQQNLQALDHLLDDSNTLVMDQTKIALLHSILRNLQSNFCAELDSRLALLRRVQKLLRLREQLSDDQTLDRLLCSLMSDLIPFETGGPKEVPGDLAGQISSLDKRWKIAKQPIPDGIVDYFTQISFRTLLDFELSIPCFYRSGIIQKKVIAALIASQNSTLSLMPTFRHVLRSVSIGRQDLEGLCRHFAPTAVKHAFSRKLNDKALLCREVLFMLFESLDRKWLSSRVLQEYSRSMDVESLAFVGRLATSNDFSSQDTREIVAISVQIVVPLLSDPSTSQVVLRDAMLAISRSSRIFKAIAHEKKSQEI